MMDNKTDLVKKIDLLALAVTTVDGNESLLSDVFSKVSGSVKLGLKHLGGSASASVVKGFKELGTEVVKTVGTRRTFISVLNSRVRKDELKESITFPSAFVKSVTSEGDINTVVADSKTLGVAFKQLLDYEKDLQAYYLKELDTFKSISKINTAEDAIKLIRELDALEYPKPAFSQIDDIMSQTDILPGGKCFTFNSENNLLSLTSESDVSSEQVQSFDKNDLQTLLAELNTLSSVYQTAAKATDKYADYVGEFNTVVGKAFSHLESVKDTIGKSLGHDLESRLQGDLPVFRFYSGFFPKAVIYLDDYVDTLTSFFSKQFN